MPILMATTQSRPGTKNIEGRAMKSEELLYQYAYDAYRDAVARKKDIRDRSAFFIGFGIPIAISLASASLATRGSDFLNKLYFIAIGALMGILAILFFFLIYCPGPQKTYTIKALQKELTSLESTLKERQNENDLSYSYFVGVYDQMAGAYETTNKYFRVLFVHLFISLFLSVILMTLSFIY